MIVQLTVLSCAAVSACAAAYQMVADTNNKDMGCAAQPVRMHDYETAWQYSSKALQMWMAQFHCIFDI